jgi:hypothetical protein
MFCPTCGREDSQRGKFCPACGVNLEKVVKALSQHPDGMLVRADQAFDRLVARYAGLLFGGARDKALDRRVSHSWLIWLQALVSLPAILILSWITFFGLLPIRLFTLLLSTPFRLLSERSNQPVNAREAKVEVRRAPIEVPPQKQWAIDSGPSVVEHTTMTLPDSTSPERKSSRN